MIGTILNSKYEVVALKGAGGFGQVYEVKEISSDEHFALKICTSTEEETLKRFARESRLIAAIDHPNVIKLVDSELAIPHPYIVMPLAKGSLENYLPNLKANHPKALQAFLVICEGIKAIHNGGQIHRDIKLANVLVLNDNSLAVSDLGLGTFESRDSTILTSSNIYMGTEGYIPPEFKTLGGTKRADQRSDVYQLGKMLYNILTGEDPILIEENAIPTSLVYIIRKATKDKSTERYQSVAELMDAINNYIASLDINAHPLKAFESYISAAKELANKGAYDKKIIENLILTLRVGEQDEKTFFDMVDKIPFEIIAKIVADFTQEFKQLLHFYTSHLDSYLSNTRLSFEYAEQIANLMSVIYNKTSDVEVKSSALQNILKSAAYFNRFYAMNVFDNIILDIRDEAEAREIAKMLHVERENFKTRIDGLQYSELHPRIREVIDYLKPHNSKATIQGQSFEDLFK